MRILLFIFFFVGIFTNAQVTISGTTESAGKIVPNANVYLKDTYDGTTSDANGNFSFETFETGIQTLIIEAQGYEIYEEEISVDANQILTIELFEIFELESAVITAGKAIESADTSMNSLDVVTTAGALGDAIGALKVVPGTQNVAEDGRLFVRGGDPTETNIYVDRMEVFQPYSPVPANTPTRSRFSPFLFKGINFNTGGYAVKYGNALSGVLEFETIDFPDENSIDINVFTVGAQVAINKTWEKDALTLNSAYYNLGLYNAIFESRDEWIESPESATGEAVYRHQFKKGLLKTYVAYDFSNFELIQENINFENGFRFKLRNNNLYANTTIEYDLGSNTDLFLGASLGFAESEIQPEEDIITKNLFSSQFRAEIQQKITKRVRANFGTEFTLRETNNEYEITSNPTIETNLSSQQYAFYGDAEYQPFRNFAVQGGIRYLYNTIIEKDDVNLRFALGYKFNKHNLSVSLGEYTQLPEFIYLEQNNNLNFSKSNQYILNYTYKREKQNFRVELYHKEYSDLIRFENGSNGVTFENLSNTGDGYATGVDVFFRDNKNHIKNLEYWLTYSYIDSKRLYEDFPEEAQPNFIGNHKVSVVGKYWINQWKSQVGFTYQFGSGRPFTNANTNDFLAERTKTFNQIDMNWAYLFDPQKILFFSVQNVFGFKNVFNYRYSNTPDMNGFFDRQAIVPQNNQFFFVGFLWTISTNKTRNQLDNL